MSRFVREEFTVNGVKTVVHTAGKGEPLVLFHGAGTVDGFEFAGAWPTGFVLLFHITRALASPETVKKPRSHLSAAVRVARQARMSNVKRPLADVIGRLTLDLSTLSTSWQNPGR